MGVARLKCDFCGRELNRIHYYIKGDMVCSECMTSLYSPRLILAFQGGNARLWNESIRGLEAFGLLIHDLERCGWITERKTVYTGPCRVAGFCGSLPHKFKHTHYLRYENRLKKCLRIPEHRYYYSGTEVCNGRMCYFHAVKNDYEQLWAELEEEDEWTPEKMYQMYMDRVRLPTIN